jgi:hypothetical protein
MGSITLAPKDSGALQTGSRMAAWCGVHQERSWAAIQRAPYASAFIISANFDHLIRFRFCLLRPYQ